MTDTRKPANRQAPRKAPGLLAVLLLSLFLALALSSCGGRDRRLPFDCSDGYGYVDGNGRVVIEARYQWAGDFHDGLAAVVVDGLWGFIDTSGTMVIEPQYEWAGTFSENRAVVGIEGKYGYVDGEGILVIGPLYDQASDFHEGLAVIMADGKHGYLDPSGNKVIGPRYDWSGRFSEGLALTLEGTTYGYINPAGEMVVELPTPENLPASFSEASRNGEDETKMDITQWQGMLDYCVFSGGLAVREEGGKYGYIDTSGRTVIAATYHSADAFSEGLAAVRTGGRWGFIDNSGNTVIDPGFDKVGSFDEELAPVMIKGIWGYIDRSGSISIDPKFDYAYPFSGGLAPVTVGSMRGYIDTGGEYVWRPTGPETDLAITRPSKLPLVIIDIGLAFCMVFLALGIVNYCRMLGMVRRGEEGRALDIFLERYHSEDSMRKIKKGPFVLDEHLRKLEKNGRIFIVADLAFLAVLWIPNLIWLATSGRGIFNYYIFHKNGFLGDDWLYNLLGTLTLLLFLAFCLVQRVLLKKLLGYLDTAGEHPPEA